MKAILSALALTGAAMAFAISAPAQTAGDETPAPGGEDLMPDGILPDDWDGLFGDVPAPDRLPDLLPDDLSPDDLLPDDLLPDDLAEGLPEGWGNLFPDGTGEDMANLLDGLRNGLGELAGQIGDLSDYHLPEVLPNGDILIRRRTPLPDPPAPGYETVDPGDPIDL